MSQLDLFIPIAGEVRAKDQQDIMAFPACSLSKQPRTSKIRFEEKATGSWIEVDPHPDHGMANIWDFDIMLYAVAYIREMKEHGYQKPDRIKFHGYDCLKFIRRGDSKKDYHSLRESLNRLQSTTVRTNIRLDSYYDPKSGKHITPEQYHQFSWVSKWKEDREWREDYRTGDNQLISNGFSVQFPDWFVDGIWREEKLLTINPKYFILTGAYERFLYRICRKFCGRQKEFDISLRGLHKRSGTTSPYRNFYQSLKKYIERGNIPDYDLAVYEDSRGEKRLLVQPWMHDDIVIPPGSVLVSNLPFLTSSD